MHAGPLTSPRLQKLLKVLADGQEHSTLDVVRRSGVLAPGTCVSELRAHGAEIDCSLRVDAKGRRRWFYRMQKEPEPR